jgi:hypothetical protein
MVQLPAGEMVTVTVPTLLLRSASATPRVNGPLRVGVYSQEYAWVALSHAPPTEGTQSGSRVSTVRSPIAFPPTTIRLGADSQTVGLLDSAEHSASAVTPEA